MSRAGNWRVVAMGALVALAVTGVAAAPPAAAKDAACGTATGPFTVRGTQVFDQNGQPFVSYGITVPGLQVENWQQYQALDLAKIAAIAQSWCANTVRLQLNQDDLLGPDGTEFNQDYLNAIKTEVSAAEQDHMVVVLNDNTEFASLVARAVQKGPTAATETFWKDLADVYGHDDQVIFDLFNEPRTYAPGMSQADKWRLWLHGGWYAGVFYPYGMAELAGYVRNTLQVQNLFWIEGPDNSDSFAGMVAQGALLKVSNVVYALHHPAGAHDLSSWYADFGYLPATGVAPVVVGEWTNYEPAPTAKPTPLRTSCWPDAPVTVPAFLQYLTAHGFGLNVYQLEPGYMIRSYADMTIPTAINPATWSCASNAEVQPGQGAGFLVMAFFRQHNALS